MKSLRNQSTHPKPSQCGVPLNRNSLCIPTRTGQTSFLEAEYFQELVTMVPSFPMRMYGFLFLVSGFYMMSNIFFLTDSGPKVPVSDR